jgi:hypothetical protein
MDCAISLSPMPISIEKRSPLNMPRDGVGEVHDPLPAGRVKGACCAAARALRAP